MPVEEEKAPAEKDRGRLTKREKREEKYKRLKDKYKEKKREEKERRKREGRSTGRARKPVPEMQGDPEQTVIIEILGGKELMSEKEMRSLSQQIRYCHSSNKSAAVPVNLLLTNSSLIREYLPDEIGNWKNVEVVDRSFREMDVDPSKSIVVLTADSCNTLNSIDKNTTYVIGGLVDRNRHKGYTESLLSPSYRTARLPMEQLRLRSSAVLSTLHVFNIILGALNGKSLEQSIDENIPQRKL